MRHVPATVAAVVLLLAGCNSAEECDRTVLDDPISQDLRLQAEVSDPTGAPLSGVPIALEGFKEHCMGDTESFGPFEGRTDSYGIFDPGLTLTLKMDNGADTFTLAAYEPATYQKLGEKVFGTGDVRGASALVVPVTLSE
jgi:hypothetical protein